MSYNDLLYFSLELCNQSCASVVSLTPRPARIRHVKCDEEKPACSKCRSTGRVCDGYETNPSTSKSLQYKNAQLFPADFTLKALSIIPGPIIGITGTNQERRSFSFFCYQTGHQLSTALSLTNTHQLILQASHSDQAVRSAVIALGSIGERLSIHNVLTPDNEQANACHDFARLQYYKALKSLRERISDHSEGLSNLPMILCFLFTVFEFLQGNDSGSLIHLRSGLNILRRHHDSLSSGLQTLSPDRDPLQHEIVRVFSMMDIQATVWLGSNTFQSPIMIPLDGPGDAPAHLDRFSTLDEAADSLDYQIVRLYYFRRLVATDSGTGLADQAPSAVHAQRLELLLQLEKWPVSLQALIENLKGRIDTEMSHRISVMEMNHKINMAILTACLQPSDQQVYADHELEFRRIVDLAKSVIGPSNGHANVRIEHIVDANNGATQPVPMFAFYAGVIQPLYLTAIKCQNLDVCREAISLLSSSPWREGAWDSATMARIAARRVQEVEDGYMDTVPRDRLYSDSS